MKESIDRYLAELAATQHSVFARFQVRARVDRTALRRREAAGSIESLSRNVFRITGAPQTDEQRLMAATLDVPGGAIAWAHSAAWAWELPGFAMRAVHTAAPRVQHGPSHLGVVHQPRLWLPEHITTRRGIAVPSLAWTVYSLAGKIPAARLLHLVDRVGNMSQTTLSQLHALLPIMAASGRNGITDIRGALEQNPPGTRPPGSGNERRFLEVMERAGIRTLRKQVDIGGHEWVGRVDFKCEETLVIFEVDSEAHHTSPAERAADAKRDAEMRAAGAADVVRVWSELLWKDPSEAIAIVRAARLRHRRSA